MSKPIKLNKVGIYMRLSHDDKEGESQSIENQRLILTRYVAEHGGTIIDEYVDDCYSGTKFNRPAMQRLLQDVKSGRIDTVVVKDLSRFGRNYIKVGGYLEYEFPQNNIRFIAINDNVDTAESDSQAMKMMPFQNVFNEWHASSTSEKVRAVLKAKQRNGENTSWKPPYGYTAGTDEKRTAIVDDEAAEVVRRIYALRLQGFSYRSIAIKLSDEGIQNPSHYYAEKNPKRKPARTTLWKASVVSTILNNPFYMGTLVLHKTQIYSFKNHKLETVPEEERIVTENAHEAIIDMETWQRVQEINRANSKKRVRADKERKVHLFSGKLICPDCGKTMKLISKDKMFVCRTNNEYGKKYCTIHSIREDILEELVKQDLSILAGNVVIDEESARSRFLNEKAKQMQENRKAKENSYTASNNRLLELDRLIQSAYEDKVLKNIPESLCLNLIQGYIQEKETLQGKTAKLKEELTQAEENEAEADEYVRRLKKYASCEILTREMVLLLIDRIEVGETQKDGSSRSIRIYYKFANTCSYLSLASRPKSDKQQIQ